MPSKQDEQKLDALAELRLARKCIVVADKILTVDLDEPVGPEFDDLMGAIDRAIRTVDSLTYKEIPNG